MRVISQRDHGASRRLWHEVSLTDHLLTTVLHGGSLPLDLNLRPPFARQFRQLPRSDRSGCRGRQPAGNGEDHEQRAVERATASARRLASGGGRQRVVR